MSELKYWLGFNCIKGIGPAKVMALLGHFGSLRPAWNAGEQQLRDIGFDVRAIENLKEARNTFDLDGYEQAVRAAGAGVLTWDSEDYPAALREIPAAPPVLYVKGHIEAADRWAVAVVGTRRLTVYGRQITRELVGALAANGITIVSGLARGIDAVAHQTALEYGGRTLAVLGSGIDVIYPPEHRGLAEEIIAGRGAVLTEYPLGAQPEGKNFPGRNRLISGLSLGVLVIEAGEQSGALITARFALEQDREVFATPGNINSPVSAGPNRLIQRGAKLVMSVEDILEELNLRMVADQVEAQAALPESAEEAALLGLLSAQPVHIDELSRVSGMPSGLVSSTLTLMELKGIVQAVGGMSYVRVREVSPLYGAQSPAA